MDLREDTEGARQPPTNPSKPKGILKNPSHDGTATNNASAEHANLTWDEQNLHYNEDHKEAKMKITEPKTPFVRYDADTDTVMDLDQIPGFELGVADTAPSTSASSTDDLDSIRQQSSRHSSFTSSRSGSQPNSRRSSDSGEKRVDIILDENMPAGGLPNTSDDEDETKWDEATRIKHAIFKNMRKTHYEKEGLVMSRKAPITNEDEEEEEEETSSEGPEMVTEAHTAMNGQINGTS